MRFPNLRPGQSASRRFFSFSDNSPGTHTVTVDRVFESLRHHSIGIAKNPLSQVLSRMQRSNSRSNKWSRMLARLMVITSVCFRETPICCPCDDESIT